MKSIIRLAVRLLILFLALVRNIWPRSTKIPKNPNKILILHNLLLGDTFLLTPLLSKIHEQFPSARVDLIVSKVLLDMYKEKPYGVTAILFHPKDIFSILKILLSGPYDIVIIPAENRFSILARAIGSRHTIAFDGDQPTWKNWMVDTKIQLPNYPMAIGDIFSTLIPGKRPKKFQKLDWPMPSISDGVELNNNAVIMHITSSSKTKMWPFVSWIKLANKVQSLGLSPYWSVAPGEEYILDELDPENQFPRLILRFAPMWHALEQASLLVSVDTSIVHLARLTQTPNITIFGPTDPYLFGAGDFWGDSISKFINIEEVPCRDNNNLFRRHLSWINICTRSISDCSNPYCINDISVDSVFEEVKETIKYLNSK